MNVFFKRRKRMNLKVIIPVYNTEKYLVDLIKSLYWGDSSKVEYIFINDNSTDKSENIIKKYMKIYENI